MTDEQLSKNILSVLERNPGATAREIANELSVERRTVNQYLHKNNGYAVRRDERFRWYLKATQSPPTAVAKDTGEEGGLVQSSKSYERQESEPAVDSASGDLIQDVLESLRRRLLDLTSRNRLLHFRHPKTGSIRVIDELPDQLKQFLADDEKEMRFIPVPDPTHKQLIDAGHIEIDPETKEQKLVHKPDAREWAQWLGLHTNYEAPEAVPGNDEDKHTDNAIQTMFFPDELETRLRSMRQKGNSAIEETGANILYLALGFLEWFEQRDANAKRLAPLYMIPVRLDRGKLNAATRTYEYRLKYSGEDILTNISLREKLRNDFQIALPELEEGVDPEAYIKSVSEAVRSREPNWQTRRYVTLCHLNFSKQLLYLDLDPDNWPTRGALLEHPLVKQCLAGLSEEERDDGGADSFGEEHSIDDIQTIHEKYPLIDDADSSQHSALIDAVDGKNLVIEGPPGTGKSQTITNLIAAAISNNKKVLFVAEKAAALEVVKRRLDQAGLGAFCLELHSHRSQKRKVLDDISDRLKLKGRLSEPRELDAEIELFEGLKDKLRSHAELINSKWKNTELSIHQLLSSATRFRQELSIDPGTVHPADINGDKFTPVERKKVLGHAKTFATVYQGILDQIGGLDRINDHPWSGVRNTSLQSFEQERVVALLQEWQSALEQISSELQTFSEAVDANGTEFPRRLSSIRDLVQKIASIPSFDGTEPFYAIPKLRGTAARTFSSGLHLYKAIQIFFEDIAQDVNSEVLAGLPEIQTLIQSTEWLSKAGAPDLRLFQIRGDLQLVNSLTESVKALQEPVSQTNQCLSLMGDNAFSLSVSGIGGFTRLSELVTSLQPEYFSHRGDCFDQDELDHVLPKLSKEFDALVAEREELEEFYDLKSAPKLDRLREIEHEYRQAGLFSWLHSNWRSAKRDLKAIRASKATRNSALKTNLQSLVRYAESKEEFETNKDYSRLLGEHFDGLKTNVHRITSLRSWYRRIREEYGVGFGAKVPIGDAIIGISEGLAKALRSLCKQGLRQESESIANGMKELAKHYPGAAGLADPNLVLTADNAPLATLRLHLPKHFSVVESGYRDEHLKISDANRIAGKLAKLTLYLDKWQSLQFCQTFLDDKIQLRTGLGQTDETTLKRLERIAAIGELIVTADFPSAIAEKVYLEPSKATIDLIKMRNQMLANSLQKEATGYSTFKEAVQLDENAWVRSDKPNLDDILARNCRAIENPQWLASWLDYLRASAQLERLGWGTLIAAIESKAVLPSKVEAAVMLGASDLLSREILQESPQLATFSGLTQQGIQQQFQEYDDRLRELQRGRIAWQASRVSPPRGNSSGRVRDYTELSLLKHEINKKNRHVPLRQLIRRSGQAISSLKPCFMMGPMSVAQYLAPGQMKFDLIVMDEASQVRPEDALGAVARGNQLVVVGDPKQLPPTSFFDKLLDEEDEEEDFTAGQQSESILDAALTTFPARRLRWHYRSQHESLIAFSNHAYYGSDLVIFPSPINKAPEFGVQFTRVKRGRFVNRVNREEAELIAKAVRQHMLTKPEESIGVVAMSAQQREQIERAIEQETKEDAQFRDLVDRDQDRDEPLFVKNLENVQGDERDVIYISMTYGPTEVGGKVAQRFGPINSINGWRRLNVLFTRSKKRMHVFSSMGTEDIIVSESSSRGVQSMKAFLEYAATGNLSSTKEYTGREPDSDFEVAVADALSDHGFECQPQVGVAGYFLDIAVKDPGNLGRYLMAIECDGATYHSAKSTRDRDRLRQRVLERLGWRVRRIWSTDWFNNAAGQLKPIIDELNDLKTVPAPEAIDEYDEAEEIEELAEEIEEDTEFVSTIVEAEVDLKTRLERFNTDVICKQHPNTTPERRFLRPAMLEALLLYRPTTIWEFQQQIPPYLRQGTEPKEGEFIKPVIEIIYESES